MGGWLLLAIAAVVFLLGCDCAGGSARVPHDARESLSRWLAVQDDLLANGLARGMLSIARSCARAASISSSK